MKRIVFDIDGVLAEFIGGFTALAHEQTPSVPVTRTHEQPSWYGFPGMTKEMIDGVWRRVVVSNTFWNDLDPLLDVETFHGIEKLRRDNEVYFCTARPGKYTKLQTEIWLRRNGIRYPTVVISKQKGEFCKAIEADFSIEDKAANASFIDWQTGGRTASYLINRPYNQVPAEFLASGVKRVNTVTEFLEDIY